MLKILVKCGNYGLKVFQFIQYERYFTYLGKVCKANICFVISKFCAFNKDII